MITKRKLTLRVAFSAALGLCAVAALTSASDEGVMTRGADGTYVVNTTTLARSVKGFAGPTPLKVYIKGDKVVRIEALPNGETAQYFDKVKAGLLARWNGLTTARAEQAQPDGVSGATYSSRAVKENVRRALVYYRKHK